MEENKYSWFPENGNCTDLFDSIEEAIKDAQHKYDEGYEEFEDKDESSPIISIGSVRHFDVQKSVNIIVDNIEDYIGEQLHDFSSGCDFESECYVSRKDKETFAKEAVQALLPIVEKYVFVNPQWVCTPTDKYDLKNKEWLKL
ncbi:hypothetical protein D0T84_00980 [Dysgonomonas sp. 521]|uniref:hypothetical protein n=1 Tax=Dysgonomonas sp. 521 TaxID=2302932 RepID=UPI0013D13D2E|nr:hypothetical protein [Dysgonomonas sp. 521]NDV93492.1 hypothetical protein [Dysgonomonas sp. 521]